MEFNPHPNKQATLKKNSGNHQSLFSNGTVVANVNEQINLGLILESKFSFERHLNE